MKIIYIFKIKIDIKYYDVNMKIIKNIKLKLLN